MDLLLYIGFELIFNTTLSFHVPSTQQAKELLCVMGALLNEVTDAKEICKLYNGNGTSSKDESRNSNFVEAAENGAGIKVMSRLMEIDYRQTSQQALPKPQKALKASSLSFMEIIYEIKESLNENVLVSFSKFKKLIAAFNTSKAHLSIEADTKLFHSLVS